MEFGLLTESVSVVVPRSKLHHFCLRPSITRVGAGYVLTMAYSVVVRILAIGYSKEKYLRTQEVGSSDDDPAISLVARYCPTV